MPEAATPRVHAAGNPTAAKPSPASNNGESALPWASLLAHFYTRAGLTLPKLSQLDGEKVPPPFKSMLVHSSDMTPTLEAFYGQPMRLTVLSRELRDDSYLREVTLNTADKGRPVEYGVIRIWLDHLPPAPRKVVLEEELPLGHILYSHGVAHLSWPQAFFRTETDQHMRSVLKIEQAPALYGRRNVLLDQSRRLLAEVIEVLAPVE